MEEVQSQKKNLNLLYQLDATKHKNLCQLKKRSLLNPVTEDGAEEMDLQEGEGEEGQT